MDVVSIFSPVTKWSVDMDADYCLFTIGLGSKDRVLCALDTSDLIITIGYDMVEYHPHLWNPKGDMKIVHIDFLPADVGGEFFVARPLRQRQRSTGRHFGGGL
jgi:acetolactate synthase-1/2/3 large subunit